MGVTMSLGDYLRENLKHWQKYSRKKITPHFQDGKDAAGAQGEDFIKKIDRDSSAFRR